MFALFTGWAEHMLVKGSATGNPLRLSTIHDYVRRVSVRIVGHSAFQDITALTAEALEEIYQQILEGATSFAQRRHHARGLREFHHYLMQRHQVDPIDEREILGIGNALAPVDANILTVDEYKRFSRAWIRLISISDTRTFRSLPNSRHSVVSLRCAVWRC